MERHWQPIARPVDQLPQEGGKERGASVWRPKKRLRDRQREAKRLVELRPITTCPTHTETGGHQREGREAEDWGGGRLHNNAECGARRRLRHRKTRLRRPRRLEGGREGGGSGVRSALEEAGGVEEQGARAWARQNILFI